jgi:TonB family protein
MNLDTFHRQMDGNARKWLVVFAIAASASAPARVMPALEVQQAPAQSSSAQPSENTPPDSNPDADHKQVYKVGGEVKPPKLLYGPDPEYTKAARKDKLQGTVVLWMIVGEEGKTRDLKVTQSLRTDLDQQAIAAVTKWKFKPATRDDQPVAVEVSVHVEFKLY